MEIRKIQKTGGSSYSITLPKSWVTKNNLEEEGIIEVYDQNQKQIIIKPQRNKILKAIVNIDNLSEDHIAREIIGTYISGVDEILIKSEKISYQQRSSIRLISYKLIGFEIMEESSTGIILKNMADSEITANEYIKKMIKIIQSMFDDVILSIKNFDKKLALDIIERDVEIDRIHIVILRQFNNLLINLVSQKTENIDLIDLHFYELAGIKLERIADHIVKMAFLVYRLKDKVALDNIEYSDLINLKEYINNLPKIIFTLDKKTAHLILDTYMEREKNEFMIKTNKDNSLANVLIQDSVERIRSYVSNISEEAINYINTKNI